jgi:hypothetical protein
MTKVGASLGPSATPMKTNEDFYVHCYIDPRNYEVLPIVKTSFWII